MAQVTSSTGSIKVFTFPEGALSAFGHDLQFSASRFDIEVLAQSVKARVDASSLRVVAAMRGEKPDPQALSASDKAEIERNCARDVLEAHRYSEATFVSTDVRRTDAGWSVRGTLTLHGIAQEISFDVAAVGNRAIAHLELDVRRFGIKPYSAMLGALRVQPRVVVVVETPLPPPG
jgi:polyisoprenoid-binding protein YceI